MKILRLLLLSCIAFSIGCGSSTPKTIDPYKPKRRAYRPLTRTKQVIEKPQNGSLWTSGSEGGNYFSDVRAYGVNDIVTIRIEEKASAQRSAQTTLGNSSKLGVGASLRGMLGSNSSQVTGGTERLMSGESERALDASGETSRSDDIRFTVAGTITKVLPNGNVYIEGERVVLVNTEEHHFRISGVARPEDIERDNTIPSEKLAQAHIEFVGRGDISKEQERGWLANFLHYVWPF
jgi:flagellar L-ring protein precursor FlgH